MKRILIIDDEQLIRRSLTRVLKADEQASQIEVYEAPNAHEGMNVWRQVKPDLVFLDILMPGMSGVQMLQSLAPEEKKGVIIILISAFTGEYNYETAQNWGAQDFIPKPFDDIFKIKDKALELLGCKRSV